MNYLKKYIKLRSLFDTQRLPIEKIVNYDIPQHLFRYSFFSIFFSSDLKKKNCLHVYRCFYNVYLL